MAPRLGVGGREIPTLHVAARFVPLIYGTFQLQEGSMVLFSTPRHAGNVPWQSGGALQLSG
eukprot:3092829-Rhodomonas_salina.1